MSEIKPLRYVICYTTAGHSMGSPDNPRRELTGHWKGDFGREPESAEEALDIAERFYKKYNPTMWLTRVWVEVRR